MDSCEFSLFTLLSTVLVGTNLPSLLLDLDYPIVANCPIPSAEPWPTTSHSKLTCPTICDTKPTWMQSADVSTSVLRADLIGSQNRSHWTRWGKTKNQNKTSQSIPINIGRHWLALNHQFQTRHRNSLKIIKSIQLQSVTRTFGRSKIRTQEKKTVF